MSPLSLSSHGIVNPFNTETGQDPPHFVGRDHEIKIFDHSLDELSAGKPRHLAIVGGYGMGKTVLIWSMEERARKRGFEAIVLQTYSISDFKDFYNIVLDGISRILPRRGIKDYIKRLSEIGLSVAGSGVSVKLREGEFEPQSALRNILISMYTQLEKCRGKEVPIVLFIDDFQLITRCLEKRVLEVTRNVFTILGRERKKISLVVSGTPELFSEFVDVHEPMIRFFEPRKLQSLSDKDVREAIQKPIKKLGITYDEEVITNILELSEGNPYLVQLLGHYTFECLKGKVGTLTDLKKGVELALKHLETSRFQNMYELASTSERIVIFSLYQLGKASSFSKILSKSKENGLKVGTTKKLIQRLHKEKMILKQIPSGQYDFQTKLFRMWLDVKKPFFYDGTVS
ncbi:MAG: ATP-binding protein [Candidatus Bathyarchaeota archaeon]|nr:ATP-binding protein [Candidatus Bathyarchaeota archaeon]